MKISYEYENFIFPPAVGRSLDPYLHSSEHKALHRIQKTQKYASAFQTPQERKQYNQNFQVQK